MCLQPQCIHRTHHSTSFCHTQEELLSHQERLSHSPRPSLHNPCSIATTIFGYIDWLSGCGYGKQRRSEVYGKLLHEQSVEKKKRRQLRQKEELRALENGETPAPRQVPKTIENQRVIDETHIVREDEEEIHNEDKEDEFASYFSFNSSPKIIITTSRKPSGAMFKFLENLFTVVPNAYYYARRNYHVKEMVKHATARGFTDLLIFNENKTFSKGARVNGLLHVHLPEGPSGMYKLTNLILSEKIGNHGRATAHSRGSSWAAHATSAGRAPHQRRWAGCTWRPPRRPR